MNSMVDSLFDQYDRGLMTRRNLVQALAALVLPTSTLAQDGAPIDRAGFWGVLQMPGAGDHRDLSDCGPSQDYSRQFDRNRQKH